MATEQSFYRRLIKGGSSRFKRATQDTWTKANPTLAPGEPGFITDTNQLVVGDGTSTFAELSPLAGGSGGSGGGSSFTVPDAQAFQSFSSSNITYSSGMAIPPSYTGSVTNWDANVLDIGMPFAHVTCTKTGIYSFYVQITTEYDLSGANQEEIDAYNESNHTFELTLGTLLPDTNVLNPRQRTVRIRQKVGVANSPGNGFFVPFDMTSLVHEGESLSIMCVVSGDGSSWNTKGNVDINLKIVPALFLD